MESLNPNTKMIYTLEDMGKVSTVNMICPL